MILRRDGRALFFRPTRQRCFVAQTYRLHQRRFLAKCFSLCEPDVDGSLMSERTAIIGVFGVAFAVSAWWHQRGFFDVTASTFAAAQALVSSPFDTPPPAYDEEWDRLRRERSRA